MAKQHAKVRKALHGIVLWCAGLHANAQDLGTPEGTTSGMLNPSPQWSAGLQIGSVETTGVVLQRADVFSGALNLGLGFWEGDLAVHTDLIWFFGSGFSGTPIANDAGYDTTRGKILPYLGAGLQVGDGIYLRAPIGVQYTMLKDPLNFYGGGTIMIGSDDEEIGIELGVLLGIRLLI